jgi:hypothetical protein
MKRIFGIIRVAALSLLLTGVLLVVVLREGKAQLKEGLLGFGQQLMQLTSISPRSTPRKMSVNGLEVGILTATTALDTKEALNRFQALCNSVGQIDLPDSVRRKLSDGALANGAIPDGVMRLEAGSEGYVACLDVGKGTAGEGLISRLVEFAKTGNLRSLGHLRYALARRGSAATTLVMLWTDGDARLGDLFPKTGDAPGRDLPGVPRPDAGRRVLSAFEDGKPFGLASYAIEGQSSEQVVAAFSSTVAKAGWRVRTTQQGSVVAEKAGRRVMILLTEPRPGQAILSIADLG